MTSQPTRRLVRASLRSSQGSVRVLEAGAQRPARQDELQVGAGDVGEARHQQSGTREDAGVDGVADPRTSRR